MTKDRSASQENSKGKKRAPKPDKDDSQDTNAHSGAPAREEPEDRRATARETTPAGKGRSKWTGDAILPSPKYPSPLRIAGLVYAVAAFAGTWAFFTCFVLFLGNFPKQSVPWLWPSIDVGPEWPPVLAALWNFGLVCLFGLQHSVMARPGFKRVIERFIPAPLERATYVHAANLAGFLLLLLWRPIPVPLWDIENDALRFLLWMGFAAGWFVLFTAAVSIDLFELLGLRQAIGWARGERPRRLVLKTRGLYARLEHPMYAGVLLGLWMTPHMSVGHALLAAQFTLYIAIGMRYERRDLARRFGGAYQAWRHAASGHGLVHAHNTAFDSRTLFARHLIWSSIVNEPLPPRMTHLLARLSRRQPA